MIERIVAFCVNRPWLVIAASLLATLLGAYLTATRFAINTNTARLIAPNVEWHRNENLFDKDFPQHFNSILAVIDADTPELAEQSADRLAAALAPRTDLIKAASRPDGGPFLEKNGLLLLPTDEVTRVTDQLVSQQAFLGPLAADPSLRGVLQALSIGLEGVKAGQATLEQLATPFRTLAEVIERTLNGQPARLSWQQLLSGKAPSPKDLRRFVLIQPILDFKALEPGGAATELVRDTARKLGIAPENGVRMRLTGSVPLADEEFATVAENAWLNLALTIGAIALILYLALRSGRIIVAVLATLFAGLVTTAGLGLLMVGAYNLISIAFAALFLGLGVDFAIQYAVRYRAERHAGHDLKDALVEAARGVGWSLTLAAVSLLAGFFSFLPTEFRGVSELGLIAGVGMIIAYVASLTLLPALLVMMRPPGEPEEVGTASLAVVDEWIARNRRLVLLGTAAIVLGGVPFLLKLPFDSNPMNLRSAKVESVSTFLDLTRNPETSPNAINVMVPSVEAIAPMAAKLSALPEVARVLSIQTFLPSDQAEKLAIIRDAALLLGPVLNPASVAPKPTDAELVGSLRATAEALRAAAGSATGPGTEAALRLATDLERLASADPGRRAAAERAVTADLPFLLARIKNLMSAEAITRENLPRSLVSEWTARDGRARIEVHARGDSNDNAVIQRFVASVRTVAPQATGTPIVIVESGRTIVRAFLEAGIYAFIAISIILIIALRRPLDVFLALGPLVLAGIMTLEAAYLVNLPLNFANIIALPLMFGVGVAFHIYYVVAWRAGVSDMLASSLTRAIFFSALTTGTGFGSLWLSSHPGTASMGELLALSLVFTLLAAFIIVPAFLGPAPEPKEEGLPSPAAPSPPPRQGASAYPPVPAPEPARAHAARRDSRAASSSP